jgi:hypothetical protein
MYPAGDLSVAVPDIQVKRSNARARGEAEWFDGFSLLPCWWAPLQLMSAIQRISDLVRRQRNF